MNSLSNTDIIKILKHYDISICGVFSKDMLPKKLTEGWYVINLQNHGEGGGTHWTCFFFSNNGDSIYFDSFRVDAPEYIHQLLNFDGGYTFNNREIQNIESSCCGYFCIALIKSITLGNKFMTKPELMKRFASHFCRNTLFNDKILKMEFL